MTQTLQQTWNKRAEGWHVHVNDSPAFHSVRDRLLELAVPTPADRCVDLGCGTGFLSLPLAARVGTVLAVDIAPRMLDELDRQARAAGLDNVQVLAADLSALELPAGSADLVVSNYALHHLDHAAKRALAGRLAQWLAPGGRVVIADMMFGRGSSARDRTILLQKVRVLAAKGPGGLWRIAKNLFRYGFAVGQERPASPDFWVRALRDAGFADVRFEPVAAEAGIVTARLA